VIDHLIFLSIPGLRPGDIRDPNRTPTLQRLAGQGASCTLTPTFPCVTSPVQASMLTGTGPGRHGVIANGFYYPEQQAVQFRCAGHEVIDRPTFFTRLARQRRNLTSAAWHAQNIKGADANYIIAPGPFHQPDRTAAPGCYSKPDELYRDLVGSLGHFPLQHYWGPQADIRSTKWIVEAVLWLAEKRSPNLQYVYLPHLDYAARKFGPDSPEAAGALAELDRLLGDFRERYHRLPQAEQTAWVLAGEYALTPVTGPVHANRILRAAGWLTVREQAGREYLDLAGSAAFAMVDHQFAHVYVRRGDVGAIAELFQSVSGIANVVVGPERAAIGMDHPRCAPVILISRPDRWFTYYWWLEDAAAPPFARAVDLRAKPGSDPLELFIDPATGQTPLDASLIKGSHGAPATRPDQQALLLTTHRQLLDRLPVPARDTDVFKLLCRAFKLKAN